MNNFQILNKLVSLNFIRLVILSTLVSNGQSYMVGNNPHHLRESIDPAGKYQLEWIVNWEVRRITFNVIAETTGFVGFGLSTNGKMTGADIVIGGVDSKGRSYFADYHAVGQQIPVRDPSQDWHLLSAHENGTHTRIRFYRALDTCDPQDYAINEDKLSVIWAIGATDEIRYHFGNRGLFHVYLLHPDYTPLITTEPATGAQRVHDQFGQIDKSVNVWTINREMVVPPRETLYWCSMHKTPRFQRKNHMIGFNVRLHDAPSIRHVHHVVIYRCNPPRGGGRDARTMFESYVGGPGQECLSIREVTGPMPHDYCTVYVQIWAVGGRSHFHPPHVAFPLESEEYLVAQVHLDNPALTPNMRVNISIDFFYTENLRPNEGGLFTVRHEIPGTPPSLLVPPHSVDHQIRALCGASCSRQMIPPEGVSVYGAFLHTHNAGRRVRMRHFRNNRELPFLTSDENYSFAYQQMRNIPEEKRILPGDQLAVECVYDSTMANGTVLGGFASSQEMCFIQLLIYQQLEDIQVCTSQTQNSVEDRKYFLAGVGNITWSGGDVEFLVDPPHALAGMRISEVSNRHVDWSLEKREELERYHLYRPHDNRCPPELWTIPPGSSSVPQTPEVVTYPYEAKPYQPEILCAKTDNN